jgi:hemerythrin-like domain-containing protein
MRALTSLIRDHQIIIRLVDGLSGYARYLEQGPMGHDSNPTPEDLAGFARFFREFADEIHHEKEESILLPMLTRHGFSWNEGVLADVRRDHEQERYLIDVLCQASERCQDWNEEDRRSIAETALALAEFQRAHLTRENVELFAEVTRRLDGAALDILRDELERFDANPRHVTLRGELSDLARRLIEQYAPLPTETRGARRSGAALGRA